MATRSSYLVLTAFVGIQMALLVLFPAATPAGFIAAELGLGALEWLVVHHVEAIQTDFVDGGFLGFGDLPARLFDFGAEVLELLARLPREQRAVARFDGGRRFAGVAMHDVRAGQHAEIGRESC